MNDYLDEYDYKILQHLQCNGRLSNQELAEIIGLSTSQCSRRRIALEQNGMIQGYYAQLHPDAELQPIMGMIEIKLLQYSDEVLNRFLDFVQHENMIREVYKLTGNFDYLLKVMVRDLNEMSQLINKLTTLKIGVSNCHTSIVLERIKENYQMMNLDHSHD